MNATMLTAVMISIAQGPVAAPSRPITAQGEALAARLDGLDVEHLWLPKEIVAWKTGKTIRPAADDGKSHTHCSAFVAAASMDLDVYILRPPAHSTVLLANAQTAWLAGEGKEQGWRRVASPIEAQALANRGVLVVAAYAEADPKKPGHIAIVRPSAKDDAAVEAEGPQIIQAGATNWRSTSTKEGFKHHKGAWADRKIKFYEHAIDWKAVEKSKR